jgi:UTP--glucose-1-phosphate uridylyltransferase
MGTKRPSLDAETTRLLQTFGFDCVPFDALRARLAGGRALDDENRLDAASVAPPRPEDIDRLPPLGSAERAALEARGLEAIARGEVGAVVLAGGMATRFGGVVKAAVEVLDGRSFLDLKHRDVEAAAARAGGRVPFFPMTSFATHAEIARLLAGRESASSPATCFAQLVSLRLTPEGELFRTADGHVSLYAPGHGDFPFALRRSGVLARFLAEGGRVLFMSNVDNLTATLDPAIVGAHLASGAAITVEVADKAPGDKGGAPARVDGKVQIVESFRFPEGFDQDRVPVFNTNTLLFDARALDRDFDLTWFAVEKEVEGRRVVQFERLVGQLTAFLESRFLRVERRGPDARFQPVKTPEDLPKEAPILEAVLKARGILGGGGAGGAADQRGTSAPSSRQ